MNNAPKKRPLFQVHLSTAVALMFVAGLLLWANLSFWGPTACAGGVGPQNSLETYCGWPVRVCFFITLDGEEATIWIGEWMRTWPWRLASNCICCAALLVNAAFMLEYLARKPRPALRLQWPTRLLLLSLAAALTWANWPRSGPWRGVVGWPQEFCVGPGRAYFHPWPFEYGRVAWDIILCLCILIAFSVVSESLIRWRAERRP
jgi:hypothetical protein